MMRHIPSLVRVTHGGVACNLDEGLRDSCGIVVAFSERAGGVSAGPFASLNLAAHVGDDPDAVDENRSRLLRSLALQESRGRLTLAEQVHGDQVTVVTAGGAGAWVRPRAEPPVAASDGLVTITPSVPLLMCYADCVPVVLVATSPARGVAVAHAGWRGASAGVAVRAAERLAELVGCDVSDLIAYIGPHVCGECYEVGGEVLSQFDVERATLPMARGRLDLGAVVSASLRRAGISSEQLATVGVCTLEQTDRFYSYRASGRTGRHGAIAAIL